MNATSTAIVTGASSGIGRATALLLAGRGYHVVLVARRAERLAALAREIGEDRATVAPMDLDDVEAVEAAVQTVAATHAPVEVLVHAAGHGLLEPMAKQSARTLQQLLNVHYLAAAAMVRVLLPEMLRRRRGHIIAVSSISAKVAPWGHGGYSAAKAALSAMIQTLHAEHPRSGVRFSHVLPGIVATEFFNNPSYARLPRKVFKHAIPPQRVADAIVELLDHPKLEIMVPASHRIIDVFELLWPSLVHGRIARAAEGGVTKANGEPAPLPGEKPAALDSPW
jgi:short-subunit dehydrogenase